MRPGYGSLLLVCDPSFRHTHIYILYIYTLFVFIEETRRKVMFAVRFRVGNPQKVRELSLEFLRL